MYKIIYFAEVELLCKDTFNLHRNAISVKFTKQYTAGFSGRTKSWIISIFKQHQ
jgi:hypothetical protein